MKNFKFTIIELFPEDEAYSTSDNISMEITLDEENNYRLPNERRTSMGANRLVDLLFEEIDKFQEKFQSGETKGFSIWLNKDSSSHSIVIVPKPSHEWMEEENSNNKRVLFSNEPFVYSDNEFVNPSQTEFIPDFIVAESPQEIEDYLKRYLK